MPRSRASPDGDQGIFPHPKICSADEMQHGRQSDGHDGPEAILVDGLEGRSQRGHDGRSAPGTMT
jgi:hypothetical protein